MKLFFLGDIAFNGLIRDQPEKNAARFELVASLVLDANIVFANLEVPVKVDSTVNENKNFIHYSLPEPTAELLQILHIGCVSLANNHIFDCKMPGLKATIEILDRLGIYHTGAGWLPEHCEPVIINGKVKIGFMAYVDKSTNPKTETFRELFINYFEKEKVLKDIKGIRNKVDKVICSIHWGNDYSFYPTSSQVSIAHELIDAGVDIIMGHHPHTLQPFEQYNGGVIFYSLGGLTFGDFQRNGKMYALYRKTKVGLIAECDLETMNLNFCTTKELIGNYVIPNTVDYNKWSKRIWHLYKLKKNHAVIRKLINFNEKVLYRSYEYFFGYYQNPVKRLFQISNIKKIKKLFS